MMQKLGAWIVAGLVRAATSALKATEPDRVDLR